MLFTSGFQILIKELVFENVFIRNIYSDFLLKTEFM